MVFQVFWNEIRLLKGLVKLKNLYPMDENAFLNIEEHLRPSVERLLTGTTRTDSEIYSLPIPSGPIGVKLAVLCLRVYRKIRPRAIGNRCVFEPSCSHYSELAIREHGVIEGVKLTINRLIRCRPGAEGIDLSCKKEHSCSTK